MLNKAQIIGHLGRDPEARYMPNGNAVSNFSIATTEKWKDKQTGEQKEATEWHRVVAYGRLAEVCNEYLAKGALVFVEGRIKTRKWTDQAGVEKYTTEIHIDEMKMLGGTKRESGGDHGTDTDRRAPARPSYAPAANAARQPAAAGGGASGFDDMDDDIPF